MAIEYTIKCAEINECGEFRFLTQPFVFDDEMDDDGPATITPQNVPTGSNGPEEPWL